MAGSVSGLGEEERRKRQDLLNVEDKATLKGLVD